MNPDVGIIGIERDAVVHTPHDADIAELDTLGIAYQKAETADGCVVANTLEGHIQLAVAFLTLDLQTLCRTADFVEIVHGNQSNEPEGNRRGVVTLLIGIDDGLNTSTCGDVGILGARLDGSSNGLGGVLGDIEHFSTLLQRSIAIIGTRGRTTIHERKALATVVAHFQVGGRIFLIGEFLATSSNGHDLHGISTSLQTYYVGTSEEAVVTYQLVVNLGIVGILSTFYIYVIGLGIVRQREIHEGRLQPTSGIDNLNDASMSQQRQA